MAADDDADEEPVVAEEPLETDDPMRLYLRDIARVPLLSAEEEVVLAKGMELGRGGYWEDRGYEWYAGI